MKFYAVFTFSLLWSVSLAAQQQGRTVLIEQFTNSGCPPCAVSTPSVYQFGRNNPSQTAVIAYHTSFPYLDSMHLENPTDANARTAFYGVNGVPHSIMDGNQYRATTSTFTSQMQGRFNQRSIVDVTYSLNLSDFELRSDSLFVKVQANSLAAQNGTDSLRLFVVVVEDLVQKSSYAASPGANSLTSYSFVMRKILPEAGGYRLMNTAWGGNDSLSLNWKLQKIKDINQLRVVVFVQNMTTKEIYQAQISGGLSTSFAELKKPALFTVFPQPATSSCTVRGADLPNSGWEIRNIHGQRMSILQPIEKQDDNLMFVLPSMKNGLYFIGNSEKSGFQKLLIHN